VETPDAVLVGQAQAGQVGAFDALMTRYYAQCLRFAWRQLGNREDAEEVVQDAFLRAYRSIRGCHDPERFRGWLFTIVINRCRTFAARRKRRLLLFSRWQERELPPASTAPTAQAIGSKEEIDRLLSTLSPPLREAFLLKHVQELSYEEMAEITGAGISALKMRVKRATAALAERLKNETHV
jgi:RNA polymerase sigma-70 factor, ECF subfamily